MSISHVISNSPKIAAEITSVRKMAEVWVYSFLLSLVILWAPPAQAYPDGGRMVCSTPSNATNASCLKAQTLLKGGLIFVKLDFNDTAKGALSIDWRGSVFEGIGDMRVWYCSTL